MAICLSLFKNGDLDEVMKHKAEDDASKSAREYKKYYENGYKTDISNINIEGNHISFTKMGKQKLENTNMLVIKF